MTTPYILGKTVADFDNTSDKYVFALRRTEDGELYLYKANLNDENTSIEFFSNDIPPEFIDFDFPGTDYFDGRGEDKVLANSTVDVKYEQWKWVNGKQSYYIDADGNFVLITGQNIDLPVVDDIKIPNGHIQQFEIIGEHSDINLYDELIAMGWNGVSAVELTISGNIRSSHPLKPALRVDRQYKNGLTIINNGNIIGCNGNLQYDPIVNRYNGVAIVIETTVDSFTNSGLIKAGLFNEEYANVFRNFNNITTFQSVGGTWMGYDD